MFAGVDFTQDIQLEGVDLTYCTVMCEMRAKQEQTAELLATIACTVTSALTGDINLFVEKATIKLITKKEGFFSVVVTDADGLDSCYLLGSIPIEGISTVIV